MISRGIHCVDPPIGSAKTFYEGLKFEVVDSVSLVGEGRGSLRLYPLQQPFPPGFTLADRAHHPYFLPPGQV